MKGLEDVEISEQTGVACSILKGGTVSLGDDVTVLQAAD
jgi:MOSC domain-containing protein YiiM